MLQLKNHTPFATDFALFPSEQGVDTLYTIVKATFNIGPQWTLQQVQSPPQKEDVYWGDPLSSSLRFASDFHTGKASSDIIVVGSACAREQQSVRQLDVKVQVGSIAKTIRVFGNRVWNQGLITTPEPFTTMPLVYERAFGGKDLVGEQVRAADARNPVGCGFVGKKSSSEMNGMPLPNLECPNQLIRYLSDIPAPACFAPIAVSWQPRAGYAGTYDETWQQTRAPYLPSDYQQRFMNSAHPDLQYPGFLQGGESVLISGMHPAGELKFNLPVIKLLNKVHLENKEFSCGFNLETLLLDPNQLQLSMVWRAAFPCDKKALKIKEITISMMR